MSSGSTDPFGLPFFSWPIWDICSETPSLPPPRLLKSLKSVSSCSSLSVAFPLPWWGFVIQTGLGDLSPSISSANIQMHNLFILSKSIHMHANDLCWPLFSPRAQCFGALKHTLAVRSGLLDAASGCCYIFTVHNGQCYCVSPPGNMTAHSGLLVEHIHNIVPQ